jgi:hypothetical protein
LYNADETGASVVQHKNTKLMAMKGKKAVASLTSAVHGGNTHERGGSLYTNFGCVSSKEHEN